MVNQLYPKKFKVRNWCWDRWISCNYRTGNYELVIANGKKLLKLAPDYFAIYNLIGLSYQGLGKWNEAIRYFEIALQINPNFLASYNNIGLSHYQLDNFDKAEVFFLSMVPDFPNEPQPTLLDSFSSLLLSSSFSSFF